MPGSLRGVLHDLCSLFNLHTLENNSSELLESGYMTAEQVAMLRAQVRLLLVKIRPNAASLVDSFNFTDQYLNSSLGRSDGRVYESLYERASADPLNHDPVVSPFTGRVINPNAV